MSERNTWLVRIFYILFGGVNQDDSASITTKASHSEVLVEGIDKS